MTETSLVDSSEDGDVNCLSKEDANKKSLQEIQRKAFYHVLQAFTLETSTMSNVTAVTFSWFNLSSSFAIFVLLLRVVLMSSLIQKRTQLIRKLMNEWEIANETHISFADKIQKNLLILQQMYVYIFLSKLYYT